MRRLAVVTDSMNMSLSKLQEMVKEREASYTAGRLYAGAATMENSMSVCMLSCFSHV